MLTLCLFLITINYNRSISIVIVNTVSASSLQITSVVITIFTVFYLSTQGGTDVHFSNRPVGVKRFQTIHDRGVGVARGLALLYGIGT
jgi:hypothetical protein